MNVCGKSNEKVQYENKYQKFISCKLRELNPVLSRSNNINIYLLPILIWPVLYKYNIYLIILNYIVNWVIILSVISQIKNFLYGMYIFFNNLIHNKLKSIIKVCFTDIKKLTEYRIRSMKISNYKMKEVFFEAI